MESAAGGSELAQQDGRPGHLGHHTRDLRTGGTNANAGAPCGFSGRNSPFLSRARSPTVFLLHRRCSGARPLLSGVCPRSHSCPGSICFPHLAQANWPAATKGASRFRRLRCSYPYSRWCCAGVSFLAISRPRPLPFVLLPPGRPPLIKFVLACQLLVQVDKQLAELAGQPAPRVFRGGLEALGQQHGDRRQRLPRPDQGQFRHVPGHRLFHAAIGLLPSHRGSAFFLLKDRKNQWTRGAAADLVHDGTRAPLPGREPFGDELPTNRLATSRLRVRVSQIGEAAHRLGELRFDSCADANLVHTISVVSRSGRVVRIAVLVCCVANSPQTWYQFGTSSQPTSSAAKQRSESVGSKEPATVGSISRTPACHAGGRGFESRRSRKLPANRHALLPAWAQSTAGLFSSRGDPAPEIAGSTRLEPRIPAAKTTGPTAGRPPRATPVQRALAGPFFG